MTITLEVAQRIIEAARGEAARLGISVSFCVVDSAAREVLTLREDGALWFTPGIARAKASTAAAMGQPTQDFADLIGQHPDLLRQIEQHMAVPPTTLGGGLPVVVDGQLIGGLGVSGAEVWQDIACAQAGLSSLLA